MSASVALVPPLLIDARLGAYRLLFPGLVAALVAVGMLLGVHRRLRQLRSPSLAVVRRSPWELMCRVAVVTCLAAAGGILTALAPLVS